MNIEDLSENFAIFDRAVFGWIGEFLNFLFDLGRNSILSCSFSSKNIKIWKKEERNFFCEKCDFFGFCDFGVNFFRKICSIFLFLSLLWARLG